MVLAVLTFSLDPKILIMEHMLPLNLYFGNVYYLTILDEHQRHAERFFGNQKRRISSIDESLLEATENILPPCAEAKTLTELSELCRLVQEAARQKMALLRTRLELLGVKPSWQDSITSPEAAFMDKGTNQIHWSVGGPLDCVIEADVETEGATTPGSLLQPSPFASTTKRKASLTPTTPTMKTFSFRYVTTWNVSVPNTKALFRLTNVSIL